MLTTERMIYEFNLGLCKSLIADIASEKFNNQPAPNVNTPAWNLGHLCITADFIASLLGDEHKQCLESWGRAFGPGSKPVVDLIPMPTKAELFSTLQRLHARVDALAAKADPASLAQPHGVGFLEPTNLKTKADLVALLMTSHEGTHLGQISMWRRLMGFPPLF